MTNIEIKKAWELFKKELKKEVPEIAECTFVMTGRQIELGTATICVCSTEPYDDRIKDLRKTDEMVQGYPTWTAEEKARCHAQTMASIARWEARRNHYGTKANEFFDKMARVIQSAAWSMLRHTIGCTASEEIRDNCFYIRIHY